MIRENTKEHGYIVWLKRSRVENPNYLRATRPDVLPNPKLWETIIGSAGDELAAASNLDGTEADNVTSSRIEPPSQRRQPAATVPDPAQQRKTTAEQNEAKDRLYYVKSAAAQMAKSANYMLSNVNTLFDLVPSTNIVHATSGFQHKVLTSVEQDFFNAYKDVDNILRIITARAIEAEKEPWKLLRLPLNATQLRARRERMLRERAEREEFPTTLAMRIADKRGHLSYNPEIELVGREGHERAGETENVAKMTKTSLQLAGLQKMLGFLDIAY